jgi:hypothetical protein
MKGGIAPMVPVRDRPARGGSSPNWVAMPPRYATQQQLSEFMRRT